MSDARPAITEEIWLEAAHFADMTITERRTGDCFALWIESDHRHLIAYQQMTDMLADDALGAALAAKSAQANKMTASISARRSAHSASRRKLLHWAAAAAVAGITLFSGGKAWQALTRPQIFITAPGENRRLDLPDGTHVFMNGGTKVVLPGYFHRRALRLENGEAYFAVAHDPAHPFTIALAQGSVTVLGTEFDINYDMQGIELDVYKGKVRFAANADQARFLTRGQHGLMVPDQSIQVSGFDPESGNWRSGWIEPHNWRLEQVTRALTRYSGLDIQITDQALRNKKITGRLRLDHPLPQLKTLSEIYHFTIRRKGRRITLHSAT